MPPLRRLRSRRAADTSALGVAQFQEFRLEVCVVQMARADLARDERATVEPFGAQGSLLRARRLQTGSVRRSSTRFDARLRRLALSAGFPRVPERGTTARFRSVRSRR